MVLKNEIMSIIQNPTIQKFLIGVMVSYLADFITGFSKAWSNKNIQSNKLRDGVVKFIQYIAFISIGIMFDFLFGNKGITIGFCITVICIEIRSLIENLTELQLKEALTKLLNNFNNNNADTDEKPEDN